MKRNVDHQVLNVVSTTAAWVRLFMAFSESEKPEIELRAAQGWIHAL